MNKPFKNLDASTYNALSKSRKAKIFDAYANDGISDCRFRSAPGAVGNNTAIFIFIEDLALIYVESNGIETYFACSTTDAEIVLDNTLIVNRAIADKTGYQFGDWQCILSYVEAAENLKSRL